MLPKPTLFSWPDLGAVTAAEKLLLRIYAPETYRAAQVLGRIRHAVKLLSYSSSNRSLRKLDAEIYTHFQSALKGRLKIRSKSVLARTETLFAAIRDLLTAIEALPGSRHLFRVFISGNMAAADALLRALERQICSVSARRSMRRAAEFSRLADEMRGALVRLRRESLKKENASLAMNELALADGFEKMIAAAENVASFDIKSRLPRSALKELVKEENEAEKDTHKAGS